MNNPNALLYKWLVINSFATLLLYVAWLQGWLALVIESDASYLSLVMAALFIVFWTISGYQTVTVNREIVRFETNSPEGTASTYFTKLCKNKRLAYNFLRLFRLISNYISPYILFRLLMNLIKKLK